MNVRRLVLREISHRKLNFALGLLSVAVAVGCFIGARTLLRADQIRTAEILAERTAAVEQAVAARKVQVAKAGDDLEDSMRKITKGLGFNILILPADQDVNELHTEGTLSKSMPAEFVDRLANSDMVIINHLLPIVVRKIDWKELKQTVYVIGTRGEVPQAHRAPKKPILDHVPAGQMVVGHQIHQRHKLQVGDTVHLMGREFEVAKTKPELGNCDDSTVWINLSVAQEMFDSKNLVNGILALECNCATEDRIAEIRTDLERILPGTQVIESGPPALARAEARNKAKQVAVAALEREQANGAAAIAGEKVSRAALETQHARIAGILVPLVIAGCGIWIGLLAFGNVRQRAAEIGILRAIGLRSVQILFIFLGKAIVIGLLGAVVGFGAGFAFGLAMGQLPQASAVWRQLFAPGLLIATLLIAPAIAALATWIPALLASRQDPALILQGE